MLETPPSALSRLGEGGGLLHPDLAENASETIGYGAHHKV